MLGLSILKTIITQIWEAIFRPSIIVLNYTVGGGREGGQRGKEPQKDKKTKHLV